MVVYLPRSWEQQSFLPLVSVPPTPSPLTVTAGLSHLHVVDVLNRVALNKIKSALEVQMIESPRTVSPLYPCHL